MIIEKIENCAKDIVSLFLKGDFSSVEKLSSGNLTAEEMKEAIDDYSQVTGTKLSQIPEQGYRKAYFSLHEEGDYIDVDDKKWSSYVLPLWFDGAESDLMLETIATETDTGFEIVIKNVLVM